MLVRILLLKIPFNEKKAEGQDSVLKLSKMGKFGKMVKRAEQIVMK